jgi:uncharacterized protein (DUF1501 family)
MPVILSRRNFLSTVATAGAFVTLSSRTLRSLAFARTSDTKNRIFVVLHMRGACDGLNLVCPSNDPHLIAARPVELRVDEAGATPGLPLASPTTKGIDWRLHPAGGQLAEFYKDGHLAFVHAAGIPEANRSHFVATDIMDHGVSNVTGLSRTDTASTGGWLARYLSKIAGGQIPSVSASAGLAGEFAGSPGALSIPDLTNGVPLPGDAVGAKAIRALYESTNGPIAAAGLHALGTAKTIMDRLPKDDKGKLAPYLGGKDAYDKSAELGRGLRTIARLIKLDVGLTAASVDLAGWDTHEGQPGHFNANVQRLSTGLGAFWNDLTAYHDRLIVVAYSEFGRRLRANRSNGTDHGRGGVMLVLGGLVKGGCIVGPWPGLDDGALDERVDLAVKTDYRQVLSELLEAHCGRPLDAGVFPGYHPPAALGLTV